MRRLFPFFFFLVFISSMLAWAWSSVPQQKRKRKKKKREFTDKEVKAREVPQASGRSKCLANRWSCCSSLWDFRNPSQKKRKEKQNGVEADTSMTLCWKAPWSLTCGGLSTSSEVERLVPSSHTTAEEEERVLMYVWAQPRSHCMHFSSAYGFSRKSSRDYEIPLKGRPGQGRSSKTNPHQSARGAKTKVRICRSLGAWNVRYKVCSAASDTLKIIQHPPKLQTTPPWHRGSTF